MGPSRASGWPADPSNVGAVVRRGVFRVADREYCWEDVLHAGRFWGEWDRLRDRVGAAEALLEELDNEGNGLAEPALDAAAEEFRYARDLLTAEDLEGWLQRWDVSLEEWENYLRRCLVARSGELTTDPVGGLRCSESVPSRAVWAEAACSGALTAWAERLAGRAALWDRWREEPAAQAEGHVDSRRQPEPELSVRLLEAFETAYDWFAARRITAEAIAECVWRRRLDWVRLEGILLTFDAESQAREAAMLGREDGDPPEVVAAKSGASVQEGPFLLEDFEPSVRDRLRSPLPNDWAGPFEAGGRFVLLFVRERVPPRPEHPDIRRRAERWLLEELTAREVSRRVSWRQHP